MRSALARETKQNEHGRLATMYSALAAGHSYLWRARRFFRQ